MKEDNRLTEQLKKIKPNYTDVSPYYGNIKRKIEMRFQEEKRKRIMFRRFSFVSGIIAVLLFAIFASFLYGKSGKVSLLRSGDIVPEVATAKGTVKIINGITPPFAYDKDTQTIWFIGKDNNSYAVLYRKLSGGNTNAISPEVNNSTNVKGDIEVSGDKVYAGIGNYLYVIDKRTHEASVIQLGKETHPTKNAPHPIKDILPILPNRIIISRDNASGITFYDPTSSYGNEYNLPLGIKSPSEMLSGNSSEVYFITHFINTGNAISGVFNLRKRSIILFDKIPVTKIFYANGLFAESGGSLLKIGPKNKVFHEINIKTGENTYYVQGDNAIYAISGNDISKYVPETNILYLFKTNFISHEKISGIIENGSTLYLIVP